MTKEHAQNGRRKPAKPVKWVKGHAYRVQAPPKSTLTMRVEAALRVREANRTARRGAPKLRGLPTRDTDKPLVNKLTAWQRNRWAAAGYPMNIARFMVRHGGRPL